MLLLERYPVDNPLNKLTDPPDKPVVRKIIDMVRNSTIIQECYGIAADYCSRSCSELKHLPDNAGRRSLVDLADFITLRKK
jgi:geranylgeranyl pyrophosphate synthase